mmetsp:Transcript_18163/g.37781  ORF Transcript_18163/g.37781 Transcript_18163/m.37781 type:complete len:263 (-) Transcript_18163:638-1426(-)
MLSKFDKMASNIGPVPTTVNPAIKHPMKFTTETGYFFVAVAIVIVEVVTTLVVIVIVIAIIMVIVNVVVVIIIIVAVIHAALWQRLFQQRGSIGFVSGDGSSRSGAAGLVTSMLWQISNNDFCYRPGTHPIEPTKHSIKGAEVVVADVVLVADQFCSSGVVFEKAGCLPDFGDLHNEVFIPVEERCDDLRKTPNCVIPMVFDGVFVPTVIITVDVPCWCRPPCHIGKVGNEKSGTRKGHTHVVATNQTEFLENNEPLSKEKG